MVKLVRVLFAVSLFAFMAGVGFVKGDSWWKYEEGGIEWEVEPIGSASGCQIRPRGKAPIAGDLVIPGRVEVSDGRSFHVEKIANDAFASYRDIVSVVVPKGVTTIGDGAFSGCSALQRIDLPEGLLRVGRNAFTSCVKLQTIALPASVQRIGVSAFMACSGLTAISMPASLVFIASSAFYGCLNLARVELPESVQRIDESAFLGCSGLETVVFKGGSPFVGDEVFISCPKLKEVYWLARTKCNVSPDAFEPNAPKAKLYVRRKEMDQFAKEEWVASFDLVGGYIVRFGGAGSGTFVEQLVKPNGRVAPPSEPTKEGCKFLGWYHGGKKYDFGSPVTEDMVLEPRWEVASVRVFLAYEPSVVRVAGASGAELKPGAEVHAGDALAVAPAEAGRVFRELRVNGNPIAAAMGQAAYTYTVRATDEKVEIAATVEPLPRPAVRVLLAYEPAVVRVAGASGAELKPGAEVHAGDALAVAPAEAGRVFRELRVNGNPIAAAVGLAAYTYTVQATDEKVEIAATVEQLPRPAVRILLAYESAVVRVAGASGAELHPGAEVHAGDALAVAPAEAGRVFRELRVNGNPIAAAVGQVVYTYTVRATDEKVEIAATVEDSKRTAVESSLLVGARVARNPIGNALDLQGVEAAVRVEVYSLNGARVYVEGLHGVRDVSIDTRRWPGGIYLVRLFAQDGARALRLVKR